MKEDSAYIEHIINCILKIKAFTANVSKDEFSKNELIQDAVIRNIEIIGEATKKVSENTKQSYYEIPWKEMAKMRDKLIHDYMVLTLMLFGKPLKLIFRNYWNLCKKLNYKFGIAIYTYYY
jgi:uncharacterized protein with HEPN domain